MAGREQEDEGTFERWKMGREVEGRGGRASVGKATAIGGGKTRKIAGYPSITALPPRTGVSRHFSILFSPIFALRTSIFYVSLFRSPPFFLFPSVKRALPFYADANARRRRRDNEPLFPFRKYTGLLGAFPDNLTSSFRSDLNLSLYTVDIKEMNRIKSRC